MDIMKLVGSLLCLVGWVLVLIGGEYGLIFLWGCLGLLIMMNIADSIVDKRKGLTGFNPLMDMPPPPLPQQYVQPITPLNQEVTKSIPRHGCKYCGKEFETEKKLRKHIGMAHNDKIEI